MRSRLYVAAAMLLTACSSAAVPPTETHAVSEAPRSVTGLPAHVEAPEGALTLFADFASARDGEVRLYLVNRTKAAIELPAEDGDPYVKLEARDNNGDWRRAQRHVFSSCGLSYQPVALEPQRFVVLRQWFPSSGAEAKVRYAIYSDLALVSNVGVGHIDASELAQARVDGLAAKAGDAPLLEEILFRDSTLTGWERQSARDNALRRLAELPPETAAPILERFMNQRAVDPNEYSQAVRSFQTVAPQRLVRYVRSTLAGAAGPVRARVLDELPFIAPKLEDDALLADLLSRVRDPRSRDVAKLVDTIAEYKTTQVEAALTAIQTDARYPRETRIRARYQHEQWFGTDVADLRVHTPGSFSDGHPMPVEMSIEIVNASDRPISFEYAEPSEVVSLYLSRFHGRDQTFFAPKSGVRWFHPRRPGARPTRVALAPGDKHIVKMAVADYFALPRGAQRLTVWASVRLPGLHAVAQLGGGGAGINPVPAR